MEGRADHLRGCGIGRDIQPPSILFSPKETRHLLSIISWLLEGLDTFLKKENNLLQKIYKMSLVWLLYLKAFRNGKQKKGNRHFQN